MRTIKFRIWDIDYKIMVHSAIELKNDSILQRVKLEERTSDNVLWWQYTGLKDMNEKEIFDGDIIEFHAKTCGVLHKGYCQEPFRKGQLFYVQNLKSGWTLTDIKIKDSKIPNQTCHVHNYDFWNNHRSFEIKGNIYQNPELLK